MNFFKQTNDIQAHLQYLESLASNFKISIIVPVYNLENYLEKCLDSLINQTYKNIEILCIDDGSKDKSLSILKEYEQKDSRIRVFVQNNGGVSAARNTGLEKMTGEYLMFCDADDWYESDMCSEMLYAILSQEVDVACCRAKLNYETKDKRLKKRYYNNRNFSGKRPLNNHYIMKTPSLLWSKIFKADIIKKYNIKFPPVMRHEDDAFWYMYAVLSKDIYYLSEKLYNYNIRSGSIVRSAGGIVDTDRLSICTYIYQFLKENSLLKEKLDILREIFKAQSSIR